eukprot:sb/3471876/
MSSALTSLSQETQTEEEKPAGGELSAAAVELCPKTSKFDALVVTDFTQPPISVGPMSAARERKRSKPQYNLASRSEPFISFKDVTYNKNRTHELRLAKLQKSKDEENEKGEILVEFIQIHYQSVLWLMWPACYSHSKITVSQLSIPLYLSLSIYPSSYHLSLYLAIIPCCNLYPLW